MAALSGAESVSDKSAVQAVYSPEQWAERMDSDGELGEYPAGGVSYKIYQKCTKKVQFMQVAEICTFFMIH